MYKIAILGCENSHANAFLDFIVNQKRGVDIEVVGIYSNEEEAARKLHEQFGVPVADSYDAFVGKIDGLIITARHGDNHYKYAKPYLDSGIPMFIDKPITVSEQDAVDFMWELKERKIPVSGGSMCIYDAHVQELKKLVAEESCGKVFGGYLRSPISMNNIYGGFFFYAQHLVHVMCEIFGYDPQSVQIFPNGEAYTCVFRYENYDVTAHYVDSNYHYYAGVSCAEGFKGSEYKLDQCAEKEFDAFVNILQGGEQEWSYEDFFAPVFILNAMYRSLQSECEENIVYPYAE